MLTHWSYIFLAPNHQYIQVWHWKGKVKGTIANRGDVCYQLLFTVRRVSHIFNMTSWQSNCLPKWKLTTILSLQALATVTSISLMMIKEPAFQSITSYCWQLAAHNIYVISKCWSYKSFILYYWYIIRPAAYNHNLFMIIKSINFHA